MIKTPITLQELRWKIYVTAKRLWVEDVEYGGTICAARIVQQPPNHVEQAPSESAPHLLGHITHDTKQSGEWSAGNPHAPFDVAEAGNVADRANAPALDPTRSRGRKSLIVADVICAPSPLPQASTLPA